MTKEITKAIILQEIEDKLKLREWEPERFTFSEEVIPIYNIGPHLGHWEVESSTKSITSATCFTFFTVPMDEEWVLRAYEIIYGGTGAHKGTGILIFDRPSGSDYIYLDMKKAQEVSYLVNLPILVTLHSGTRVCYFIDSYTSTQDLTIHLDVKKEEIR